jgi:hypothetical protein
MVSENSGVAFEPVLAEAAPEVAPAPDREDIEDAFFRRGEQEDQAARRQLRERLAAMPPWKGLGWAIALVAASVIAAAVLLLVIPPPG